MAPSPADWRSVAPGAPGNPPGSPPLCWAVVSPSQTDWAGEGGQVSTGLVFLISVLLAAIKIMPGMMAAVDCVLLVGPGGGQEGPDHSVGG